MASSDPKPPFDSAGYMLSKMCDQLTAFGLEWVRAKGEVKSSIDFDWRPAFVIDLRWYADPGALSITAKVSGLSTVGRPMAEIQAGFDKAAEQKPGALDKLKNAESEDDLATILAEAELMPIGPFINAKGDVCYENVVELLARDLTWALIRAMTGNAADVLMDSIWCAGLSEPIHEP